MNISMISILEDPPKSLWNSVLGNPSDGNLEQTFESGEVAKAAFPRTRVARLLAMSDGKAVGIVQGVYSRYFGFGMNIRVPYGPIVNMKGEEGTKVFKSLLMALEDFGVRKRIIRVDVWWPEGWGMHEIFRELGYVQVERIGKYVVDLNLTKEELWKSIAHNKRRNIKKAIREGVEVTQANTRDGLLTFYRMLKESAKRNGFTSPPTSWFKAIWKICKPGELSRVFLARWKGRDVAGVFTLVNGKTIYALGAGSLKEGWKARPNDLLHWKVMEWACEQHFTRYHMGLVSQPVPSEGSASWGIWRWKREWNGNLKSILIFEKVCLPRYKHLLAAKRLLERSYERVRRLRG